MAALLLLSAAAGAAVGQEVRPLVFFSGDAKCGYKNKAAVAAGEAFGCATVETARGPVNSITYRGIRLSVAFLEDDDYNIVGAAITNQGGEPVYFDADAWGGAHFRKRSDFQERKQPMLAELSIPSRDIVREMSVGTKYENSLDTFIAEGQRTSEIKEIRRPDGTRYRIRTIVPDKDAQERAQQQSSTRSELTSTQQRHLRETALTAKSVAAGSSIKGLVYFRKVKDAEFSIYSISVGGTTYVFQLPRAKK